MFGTQEDRDRIINRKAWEAVECIYGAGFERVEKTGEVDPENTLYDYNKVMLGFDVNVSVDTKEGTIYLTVFEDNEYVDSTPIELDWFLENATGSMAFAISLMNTKLIRANEKSITNIELLTNRK